MANPNPNPNPHPHPNPNPYPNPNPNFQVMSELPRAEALVFFRDVTTLRTLSAVSK